MTCCPCECTWRIRHIDGSTTKAPSLAQARGKLSPGDTIERATEGCACQCPQCKDTV